MDYNFSTILRKAAHLILICIVLIGYFSPSKISAQMTGQVSGRITDAETKEYLPGANVILKGTRFGDATDKVGLYKISNVPPGDYELVVTYLGYETHSVNIKIDNNGKAVKQDVAITQTDVKMGEVVVTGLRQGQTKAMNVQKTADKIVNVVSQEQMVRLPDLNTAEILARVAGVSIVRDMGEGRYVQIRGTDARLTSINVNGEKIIAPDPGQRYVGMDVISASQAASIEVSKTVTPDMDGDAVGGSVNIKTKSAFDSDKPFLNVTVGSGTSDLLGKPLWQGGFTYGMKFGDENQFGFALTGNYDKWNRASWDLENTYNDVLIGGVNTRVMTDMDQRLYNTSRERMNVAASLEYQPSSDNNYFIRGMYNNRDDIETRDGLYARPSKGTFATATTVSKAKIYQVIKDRLERQNIFAFSAGAIHKFDNFLLDYTFAYNEGGTIKHDETDPQFVMSAAPNLSLDLSNPNRQKYSITSTGPTYDQYNPDNYKFDQAKYNNDDATDTDYMTGANIKYNFKLADYPSVLKAGAKLHFREKVKLQNRYTYKWGGSSSLLMGQFVDDDVENIYDGTYTLGRFINAQKFRTFFNAQKNVAGGMVGTLDHINSEGASFTADENTMAYYVMNTWNLDDWMVIAGFRHEFTDLSNNSSKITLGTGGVYQSTTAVDGKINYNNFLPSVQVRYKVSPMANIRASWTNTLARPNFFDVVPYQQVDPDNLIVTEGNPTLLPTTSTSFDLLGEQYFQDGGLISAGFFYKKLDNIIFTQTSKVVGGLYNSWWHVQPINGGSSTLVGAEVNFEYQLKFLPGFLDGLGIAVNYAYTHSTADVGDRLTRSELPGQAANVANFVLSYENYGFTGRMSIGYNGQFTEVVGADASWDRIYKAHTQMDISASQDIIKGLQLYFEWINVNDAPMIYFQGNENHPLQQEWYASWMHFGFKYKM